MARIPMFKRLVIMVCNIVFPPVAVMMITGLNTDVLVNTVLFLLAVIPSHIHGFYISWVYFNRKRKVRRGIYPGDKRSGIWSEKVNNGGATRREMQQLKDERDFGKLEKRPSQLSRPGVSRQLSNRIEDWDDGLKETLSRQSSLTRRSTLNRRDSERGASSPRQILDQSGSQARSRSRSLTRRLSDRLEDQFVRRMTAREDRRQYRDDDGDADSYGDSTEMTGVPVRSVRRWR